MTPTDGVNFSLKCYDGLYIQEYFIFYSEDLYDITKSEDDTKIEIMSNKWLNKNSGFVLTISDTPKLIE